MKEVTIYTDGACSGNPGPGGWGAILEFKGIEKEISGFEANTTNNRMELTAAIEALGALREPCEVRLHSDSSYLINAFEQRWIDIYPREGKTGGAFCSGMHPLGISYVMTNFDGSYSSVSTLAHELGHRLLHCGDEPDMEREADCFASHLLCPRQTLGRLCARENTFSVEQAAVLAYVSASAVQRLSRVEELVVSPEILSARMEEKPEPEETEG